MATNEFTPRVRRVSGTDPGNLMYATSLIRARRFDEARDELEKILRSDKDSFPANLAAGVVCQAQRDYQGSLDYLNKAISLDPMRARPSLRAGYSYLMLENAEQAEAMFRNALALDPNMPQAHTALGWVISRNGGEAKEAVSHLQEALRLDPQSAQARLLLARLHRTEGNTDAAVAELDGLLKVSPGNVEASLLLSAIHFEQNEPEKAAKLLETASRYRPDAARVWDMLGRARLRIEDYPGAEKAYREFVRLRPNRVAGTLGLVGAIVPQGKLNEANELLKNVPRRAPIATVVHKYYGDIFVAQGMLQEGAQSYRAALLNRTGGSEALAEIGEPPTDQPDTDWQDLVNRYQAAIEKLDEAARERAANRDWQALMERFRPQMMDLFTRAAEARDNAGNDGA